MCQLGWQRNWYLRKKLTIFWISKRQIHWDLHKTNIFICRRGIAVVNGSNRAIRKNVATRNCVRELWLMIEPWEIPALGNVDNVKISDLLAFVVMPSFALYVFIWKSLVVEPYTSFKIMKTFIGDGGDSFRMALKNQWHFYFTCHFVKRYLNNYFPMKLLLQEGEKKQYQSKWNKDF